MQPVEHALPGPVAAGQDATTATTLQGKAGDVILRGEHIDLQAGSGIYAHGDGVRQGGTVELSTYAAANHYLVVSNAGSSLTLGGTVRAGTINATSNNRWPILHCLNIA